MNYVLKINDAETPSGVLEEPREDIAAKGRLLPLASGLQGRQHVGRKQSTCLDAEIGDLPSDIGRRHFPHERVPSNLLTTAVL